MPTLSNGWVFAVVAVGHAGVVELLVAPRAGPETDHRAVVAVAGRGVTLKADGAAVELHPLWLRERSTAGGQVDPVNRQRLIEPDELAVDLAVVEAGCDGRWLDVGFSDGHRGRLEIARLLVDAGVRPDPEAPPAPVSWQGVPDALPTIEWADVERLERGALIDTLGAYFRYGFFRIRGTPTEPGSLRDIAGRFGKVSATNFGELFDVRSVPDPVDLAYTPVALSAHTDQPYRRPAPGIQFLHALVNDAPGGDSTLVDGLAAVEALAAADPESFEALSTTDVEFRYDIGGDVVVRRAPIIELDRRGELRHVRYSPRLDFAPALPPDRLDVYYRGRRWLADHLNDPANQLTFRLAAGDAVVIDNARVLHGRTSFDPSSGHRHLQGCYIDHDGPDTMWRLAVRRGA